MLNRRELLQRGAALAGGALALGKVPGAWAAGQKPPVSGMNIVVFISDQERAIQHFPRGWAQRNLPGLTRLQQNGLTFENAFCAACMCSPTRASLLTGYFPAQHGVKYTLEESMDDSKYPQVELPQNFKNLASVMAAAGYNVVYKGKWHLSKPAGSERAPSDVAKYGFARWNPPDAGANQDKDQEGGGSINNDGRFMNQTGSVESGQEGALQYLNSAAAQQQPFFLIISLINPHDVLEYPKSYADDGYDDSWLEGEIRVPATVDENLSTKPSAQRQFLRISKLIGLLDTHQKKRNYLNFYGNLMKADRLLPGQRPRCFGGAEPARQHAGDPHLRPRRNGAGARWLAPEVLQHVRGDDAGAAGLLQPAVMEQAADVGRDGLARRHAADAGEPRPCAGFGSRQVAGGRLLRSGALATRAAAPGLRRVHLRRLAGGTDQPTIRQAAAAHHQRARAALEDRRVLRRP